MTECTCPVAEDFIGIDDAVAGVRGCPVHGTADRNRAEIVRGDR